MFQKQVIENSKLTKNFLKNNPHILITKADKGNTTVAMDKNKYILQATLMLSDKKTYEPLKKDPTNITHNKVNNLIKLWREKNYITENLAHTLKSSNPLPVYNPPEKWTALTKHEWHQDHTFNFNNIKIVDRSDHYKKRMILEMTHILYLYLSVFPSVRLSVVGSWFVNQPQPNKIEGLSTSYVFLKKSKVSILVFDSAHKSLLIISMTFSD